MSDPGREARARSASSRCMSEMHDVSERVEDIFARALLAFCDSEIDGPPKPDPTEGSAE